MIVCDLSAIRAIFSFPEAYTVHEDGTKNDLEILPLDAYPASFVEFYCITHDCSFKQWKAVQQHIGGQTHKHTT